MKTVILCGGLGTRLQEATGGIKPKPMVEVGGRPILWHIMKGFAHHGHTEFVLCLGHLGNVIKNYFLHYEALNSDITLRMGDSAQIDYHRKHHELDWAVTMADTGPDSKTGSRVSQIARFVKGKTFMLTYGDGVADISIPRLVDFHRTHGRIATVTGVRPIGRFGELSVTGDQVDAFKEKPVGEGARINGGFFVFEPGIFDYVRDDPDCVLEHEPLEKLAADGELMMYRHDGFWHCLDTYRDLVFLEKLTQDRFPPWQTWA